jgi:hypothetical protein
VREELRVIIPPCRDEKNQSINHTREILGKKTTQEFIPRFTCFPTSYSPLWQYTHLSVRELIDYQESSPRQALHNRTQDGGSSKPRAPLEYSIHELPRGRIKNPLQHLVRAPKISNCELNHLRSSKPSTASGNTEE